MNEYFKDKKVLVTGGSGSIGSEVVQMLLQCGPRVIRVFSNDENGQFNLEQRLSAHGNLRFLIGDVKDKERLRMAAEDIDIVFHAAALKHVPLCEYNPFEAVKTNVVGTQNVLDVSLAENVEKFITISTDKAVNPLSVMGATKLLAERLTISANYYKGAKRTAFSCVRFGNVLGSRGSVVSLIEEQIQRGGPVKVTDSRMTRFVINKTRAAELVLRAAEMAQGGEIFLLKMPALRVMDLVEELIAELAPKWGYDPKEIKIETIGRRAGEKYREELMTKDEAANVDVVGDIIVIRPMNRAMGEKRTSGKSMSPQDQSLLSREEIRRLLKDI